MAVATKTGTVLHFSNGMEVPSASGRTFPSIDPAHLKTLAINFGGGKLGWA
jgi:hypothetical protein